MRYIGRTGAHVGPLDLTPAYTPAVKKNGYLRHLLDPKHLLATVLLHRTCTPFQALPSHDRRSWWNMVARVEIKLPFRNSFYTSVAVLHGPRGKRFIRAAYTGAERKDTWA